MFLNIDILASADKGRRGFAGRKPPYVSLFSSPYVYKTLPSAFMGTASAPAKPLQTPEDCGECDDKAKNAQAGLPPIKDENTADAPSVSSTLGVFALVKRSRSHTIEEGKEAGKTAYFCKKASQSKAYSIPIWANTYYFETVYSSSGNSVPEANRLSTINTASPLNTFILYD